MNSLEALNALISGKKICRKDSVLRYIVLDAIGKIYDQNGLPASFNITNAYTEWEVYSTKVKLSTLGHGEIYKTMSALFIRMAEVTYGAKTFNCINVNTEYASYHNDISLVEKV